MATPIRVHIYLDHLLSTTTRFHSLQEYIRIQDQTVSSAIQICTADIPENPFQVNVIYASIYTMHVMVHVKRRCYVLIESVFMRSRLTSFKYTHTERKINICFHLTKPNQVL